MQNRERLQVQSTSVLDFNSTNMLDVSTITLYHVFKATPPFTIRFEFWITSDYFKKKCADGTHRLNNGLNRIHRKSKKKQATILLTLISPNIDWLSKFFQWPDSQEISKNTFLKSRHMHYTVSQKKRHPCIFLWYLCQNMEDVPRKAVNWLIFN